MDLETKTKRYLRLHIKADHIIFAYANPNQQTEKVIQAIMSSMSSNQASEVKAWEEEITACTHSKDLVQEMSRTLEQSGMPCLSIYFDLPVEEQNEQALHTAQIAS